MSSSISVELNIDELFYIVKCIELNRSNTDQLDCKSSLKKDQVEDLLHKLRDYFQFESTNGD